MSTRREFLTQTAAAGIAALSFRRTRASEATAGAEGVVQTVLGSLDPSKLGFTLTHEHIADAPEDLNKWPKGAGGRAGFVAKAVEQLKLVRAAGVSTIVDLTTYDVWRDIRFLEEVSRKSGLNVIASTGQRFFPPITHVAMPARTIEGLTEFFKKEIEQGIDGTRIKAGVIKIGIVGKDVTALEQTGLRAAVRASKATGVPIRIHTDAAHRAAESQAAILEAEDVDPARVSFDHSDDSGDIDYFLGLVKRGYSLGMDHVHRGTGANVKPSFERRAECIKLLLDAGFADKIFLSQDVELGGLLVPEQKKDFREKMDPPEGMLFNTRKLIPYLEGIGVSDQQIRMMTVENPKRFFTNGRHSDPGSQPGASLTALANAAAPDDRIPFGVDSKTVRIKGWFFLRGEGGEMMVNSTKGIDTFNPLNKEESRRCVSLVNATGQDSLDYIGLNDHEVVVSGFSMRYKDIPLGDSDVDRMTDHRYYNGQWVQGACLREWVFVATRIELRD